MEKVVFSRCVDGCSSAYLFRIILLWNPLFICLLAPLCLPAISCLPRRPASIRTFQLYRTTSMAELKKLQYESSESLCQRLVHPKGFFKEYLDIFLATMSAFMTPMEVLEFLIKCFNEVKTVGFTDVLVLGCYISSLILDLIPRS